MENPEFICRLKYERGEDVRFVSHLDFVKVFERALRRAAVRVAYSEGFNPRMLLVFGNPLPVGFTSCAEFVDIKTQTDYAPEELCALLNSHLPAPVRIISGVRLVKPYDSIVKSVRYNTYRIFSDASDSDADNIIRGYNDAEGIETVKKSKSGPKTVEIKQLIRRFGYDGEGRFTIETCGTQENNLRPDVAFNAITGRFAPGSVGILHIHKTDSSVQLLL